MSISDPHLPTPAGGSAPVAPEERILTLDVLRGVALLGVLIANVWLWFSGLYFRMAQARPELRGFSPDSVAHHLVQVLVSGKAIATFSFLFGVGLAVQARRAEARGAPIGPLYLRRLAVLLAIGLAHGLLLWYGDILTVYAVLGFALLLFRRRADRALLAWSGALVVALPLALAVLRWVSAARGGGSAAPAPNAGAWRLEALEAFRGGDPLSIVPVNARVMAHLYLGPMSIQFIPYLLGLFILGLWVGRRRILEEVEARRAALARVAGWGLAVGLAASVALALARGTWTLRGSAERPWLFVVVAVIQVASAAPLAAGYVASLVLLLRSQAWRRRLSMFAPVGRMALSNYLSQTVICLLLFYGYGAGLIGRVGPAGSLGIALAVFAAQAAWSPWWLARFHFGPAEWLWRSLTYGRAQPMRIRAPAARPGLAV